MHLKVLATGSSGNASVVIGKNEVIAIDFGLSYKKWNTLLEKNGVAFPDELFITHGHSDHSNESGLSRLLKTHANIKIHNNRGIFETSEFTVEAFLVPHDVVNNGLVIIEKSTGKKLVYVTDIFNMYDTLTRPNIKDKLTGADIYALESNYDNRWLKFPEYLDQMNYRYNVFNNMSRHTSKQESIKTFSALKQGKADYVPLHMSSRFFNFS